MAHKGIPAGSSHLSGRIVDFRRGRIVYLCGRGVLRGRILNRSCRILRGRILNRSCRILRGSILDRGRILNRGRGILCGSILDLRGRIVDQGGRIVDHGCGTV